MVEEHAGTEWTFVIDTNQYAGNFEREMCAWLTGRVGECGVGAEMAEVAKKEIGPKMMKKFDGMVTSVPDEDNGCCRPTVIWPNPRWFNDGMGNEWRKTDKNTAKQLKAYVKSVVDYETPHIKRFQQNLKDVKAGKEVSNWTVEACEREIKRMEKEIAKAKALKKTEHYPAYMSVAIWFYEKPTQDLIDLMKQRAETFAEAVKRYGHMKDFNQNFKLTIEGFRLIHKETTNEEMNV